MPSFTGRIARVLVAALIGLILAVAGGRGRADNSAPPDNPAVSFTTASLGFDPRYLTLGWVFSPNADVLVDALGYYDRTGHGLKVAHKVGIFDNHGTLLAVATVAAGTKDALTDSFRYAPIPPITLTAGEIYTIAATTDTYLNPNGYDFWGRDAVGLTSDSSITIPAGAGRFEIQKKDGLTDPTRAGQTNLYAGPNFLISDASSAGQSANDHPAPAFLTRRQLR